MTELIYLDNNASTPIAKEVFEAMRPYLEECFGNPSCNHPFGWDAAEAIRNARTSVATLLGCSDDEVIFTSGGTESNNIAITGTMDANKSRYKVVTTTIEHPAVVKPCAHLEHQGLGIVKIPVDSECVLDREAFVAALDETVGLVTVMHANNETGSIQPIRELADAAHAKGITVHTDAAQSVGKVRTNVDELGVDVLSIAGHKLYAPKGVGALYVRRGTKVNPVLLGAGHEFGLRPGTENVAGIVALAKACDLARERLDNGTTQISSLRDLLHERLRGDIPGLQLNGHEEKRLPNTLNVSFPGVRSNAFLPRADRVAASTGAACHEGGDETPSSVLMEMGMPKEQALGAVRLSLGYTTTKEDIEAAAASLIAAYRSMIDS